MIFSGRHTQNMKRSEDDNWSSDFIINKTIRLERINLNKLDSPAKTIYHRFVLSFWVWKKIYCLRQFKYIDISIFLYSPDQWTLHCILIKSARPVRLCVNINQCISVSSALSGSPGLWLINELFSTLSPLLLTTYHQPPPHNINQTLSSTHNKPRLSQRKLDIFPMTIFTFFFKY